MEASKKDQSPVIYHEDTELRLGLPGTTETQSKKRPHSDVDQAEASPKKVQAIGWPPIRSFRKNILQATKKEEEGTRMYVKVSMDGAPFLRKVDLRVYKGYKELLTGLEEMFKLKGKTLLIQLTYEDKDGDWMLAGDVPWEMFLSSCKKLRIMKGSSDPN